MKMFGLYLLVISAISVALVLLDRRAMWRRAMRVPWFVLLLFAALGGSVSMFVTMLILRHNTRYPVFMIGLPVIFVLQICLLLFAIWRWTEAAL